MTSWSLWTVLFSTYNLVSFCFCCCLILFEYNNKCERVCAFSVMFFCAESVQWRSKTGVDHSRSCQQGFCCSGICLTFCPTHLHNVCFSTFQVKKASGLDQPYGTATMLQTLVSGSHTMTCLSLWWDMPVHLGEFSYVNFLYFYGLSLFSFTNLD